MPDARPNNASSSNHAWRDAFAALPLDAPDASAWPAVDAHLDARRRTRWPVWLATAAVLALVAVVPLRRLVDDTAAPASDRVPVDASPGLATAAPPDTRVDRPASTASPASASEQTTPRNADFERLYAESAQLEAVLAMARDDRVTSGPAAAMSDELDAYLASIDAALSQPALPRAQRLALWDQRVAALRQVTGFQTTQRWLAANGDRYDGALVSIN